MKNQKSFRYSSRHNPAANHRLLGHRALIGTPLSLTPVLATDSDAFATRLFLS
jgi:hypothetical protein